MKIYLNCMQCDPFSPHRYKKEVEYNEEGYYTIECPNGHKSFIILQEEKFETLFQIGAHAIYDGYYREAVSSFTSSLERFYEFCVQLFCKKHNIEMDKIEKACKFFTNSSERQFGSFLFLYLIEFGELPFSFDEDTSNRNFRNGVIHKGKIPTKEEAIKYGDCIRKFILKTELKLQKNYEKELSELIFKNLSDKAKQNINNYPVVTMCQGNIISLANGEIEKSLEKSFVEEIESMKKQENGMKMH